MRLYSTHLISALSLLTGLTLLYGCSDAPRQPHNEASASARPAPEEAPPVSCDTHHVRIDSLALAGIKDKTFAYTQCYLTNGPQRWYLSSSCNGPVYAYTFRGSQRYGLVSDAPNVILSARYDKIGNPGLVMARCLEISRDGKVGLFDMQTLTVLEPQFDYLVPGAWPASHVAWGLKAGKWHKIVRETGFVVAEADFSPVATFASLAFDALKLRPEQYFRNLAEEDLKSPGDPTEGAGVVFTPSFVEKPGVSPPFYYNLLLPDQQEVSFATVAASAETDEKRSLTEEITAFLLSAFEEGIDGRGYATESHHLVVYDAAKQHFTTKPVGEFDRESPNEQFCHVHRFRFLSDSLVEVMFSVASHQQRYYIEPRWQYYRIDSQGKIDSLTTNRYYAFTKFAEIDESYFKGCFAWYMDHTLTANEHGENMWMTSHFSLNDLDLMRNEILAEYGFRFNSPQWQQFFNKYAWYKPLHTNVDALLTPRDKKNLEVILKVRARLTQHEAEMLDKRAMGYSPAG